MPTPLADRYARRIIFTEDGHHNHRIKNRLLNGETWIDIFRSEVRPHARAGDGFMPRFVCSSVAAYVYKWSHAWTDAARKMLSDLREECALYDVDFMPYLPCPTVTELSTAKSKHQSLIYPFNTEPLRGMQAFIDESILAEEGRRRITNFRAMLAEARSRAFSVGLEPAPVRNTADVGFPFVVQTDLLRHAQAQGNPGHWALPLPNNPKTWVWHHETNEYITAEGGIEESVRKHLGECRRNKWTPCLPAEYVARCGRSTL